jgi:glycine/D-amino acid oxidase-like deaminating enzyme
MADVVIVGGGIIGAAITYRLAQAGVRVTLLEAGQLASGTSGASFAWLNANNKPPFPYHLLNVSGMAEHRALREEFGQTPWLHMDGSIEWATDAAAQDALREKIGRLRAWGYPAEILTRDELRRMEPDLTPPAGVAWIAAYPTEGYAHVPLLIGALAGAARDLGARVRPHCRVAEIARTGGRVTGIVTADGERIAADIVVSCTGRWSGEFAALAGAQLPMQPSPGLLVVTAPAPVRLRTLLNSVAINIRPDGGGRLRLQSTEFDDRITVDTPTVPLPEICAEILRRAVAVLPALAGTPIEAALIAGRPIPRDGFTVIGPAPGADGLYLICTHSGVTMGPFLGRLAARELMTGEADPRLATFRPERLLS